MKIILILLTLITLVFAKEGRVRYIVDGDTLKLQSGIVLRFAYIDTPESKRNKRAKRFSSSCRNVSLSQIIKAGKLSSSFTKSLIAKDEIVNYNPISTDRYGRKVAVIYNSDGLNINETIILDGYGVVYKRYTKGTTKIKYNHLQNKAISKKNGLWKIYPKIMQCLNLQ